MSVLSESSAANVAAAAGAATQQTETGITIPPEVEEAVKAGINALFWRWYHEHEESTITHAHFWFFTREIKVKDLRELFVFLFGAEGNHTDVVTPVTQ